MPCRWFVPVLGVDPQRVRLEHVHAAFTRWFDRTPAEHSAGDKPYTVSPLTRDDRGVVGVCMVGDQFAAPNRQALKHLLQAYVVVALFVGLHGFYHKFIGRRHHTLRLKAGEILQGAFGDGAAFGGAARSSSYAFHHDRQAVFTQCHTDRVVRGC